MEGDLDDDISDLIVENRRIPAHSVQRFSRFMAGIAQNECSDSVYFAFSNSGLHHDILHHRMDEFCGALRQNTNLIHVEFMIQRHAVSDQDFTTFWNTVGRAVGDMPALQQISFCWVEECDGAAIASMMQNVKQIRSIHFEFQHNSDQQRPLPMEECQALAHALAACGSTNVREVHLSDMIEVASNDIILAQLSNFPNLNNFLYQSHNFLTPINISEDTVKGLFGASTSDLGISLEQFLVTESTCKAFSRAFSSPDHTRSIVIQLDNCQVVHACFLEGLEHNTSVKMLLMPFPKTFTDFLSKSLGNNTGLDTLWWTCTPKDEIALSGALAFLHTNTTLNRLHLIGSVGPIVLQSLGQFLAVNKALTRLVIENRLGSPEALVEFLTACQNCSLEYLYLSDSNFGKVTRKQVDSIVSSLSQNLSLRELETSGYAGPRPGWITTLEYYFDMNALGRGYLKDQRSNRQAYFNFLCQIIENLDYLYLHLQENPFLCL